MTNKLIRAAFMVVFMLSLSNVLLANVNNYQIFNYNPTKYVPFDSNTVVVLDCPDESAHKWLENHFKQWYKCSTPKIVVGDTGLCVHNDPEAYAALANSNGVKIAANTLSGVRWASYTLRQLVIAKRGTLKTEGYILPELSITDRPHLAFRAVHLCWFPETCPEQIERAIRLAALLKFNYVIIEPWGTYKSEKFPWRSWPKAPMTKEVVNRLVKIGKDLGVTLIPQLNCYGHASLSRMSSKKHSALDINPDYEPIFEPGGWNWCLSNPETQRVMRGMIAELHDNFGNPPYFHIGCDEALPMSCPDCIKTPTHELVSKHISGIAQFISSRGARAMMWHDMLLDSKDKRWKGFVTQGNKETSKMINMLPKDIVICDWQYSYGNMNEVRNEWPTIKYFKDNGFLVAGCPWMNYKTMKPMADFIVANKCFGFIETTWHRLRGAEWERMFSHSAHAAWGTPVSHGVSFERSLRLVGYDMKIDEYECTGNVNYQIPPSWWNN